MYQCRGVSASVLALAALVLFCCPGDVPVALATFPGSLPLFHNLFTTRLLEPVLHVGPIPIPTTQHTRRRRGRRRERRQSLFGPHLSQSSIDCLLAAAPVTVCACVCVCVCVNAWTWRLGDLRVLHPPTTTAEPHDQGAQTRRSSALPEAPAARGAQVCPATVWGRTHSNL